MNNSRSFGRQRHDFVDPMEPAPLFNTRADYTQVVNVDEFRIPDLDHSPVMNTGWDSLNSLKGNDDHVCHSMPAEVVRDDHHDKHQYARRAHAHHDEAVRLLPQGLMNTLRFHTFPQPLDTWWQSLGRQQGRDFAQRDAVCNVETTTATLPNLLCDAQNSTLKLPADLAIGHVAQSYTDHGQGNFTASDIKVSSQEQRPISTPLAPATTTVNIDGVDLRQHKQRPVNVTNSRPPRETRCLAKAVLGLRKTVNARLKRKAPSPRRPESQRRSHILLERERRLAMTTSYDILRDLLHLENSEITARTDKATVVLEATNRIVSLEAQAKEMLEELKRTRRSRNSSPATATATATATAPVASLPNLVRPQSYFTANVRLHVSGLGQVWITIHSPEEARQLRHRLLELVTTVIASRSHLDIVHLNVSRVGFTRFYTLHCQTTPGSVFAVDELHTTLQMVVNSELVRMRAP